MHEQIQPSDQAKAQQESTIQPKKASDHKQQNKFSHPVQTKQARLSSYQSSQGNKQPVQTKQGKQSPYQSKEGRKGTIQAKQRPVQRKPGGSGSVPMGNNNEAQIKANVSSLMGVDVSSAQVNYNSSKPAQLKAEAFAQGNTIEMAPGKEHHLGHELVHVGQQTQGRVQATTVSQPQQANNGLVNINDDPKLEKEADDIGAKAHSMAPVQMKQNYASSSALLSNNAPVQGMFIDETGAAVAGDEATQLVDETKRTGLYQDIVGIDEIDPGGLDATLLSIITNSDNIQLVNEGDPGSLHNDTNYQTILTKALVLAMTHKNNSDGFKSKTFKDMADFARDQADWHTADLNTAQRGNIRNALAFIREENVVATMGNFSVGEFLTLYNASADQAATLRSLREYVRARHDKMPIDNLTSATTLVEAEDIGERLLLLQQAVPFYMLNTAMYQYQFQYYGTEQITALKNYVEGASQQPFFQTKNNHASNDFYGFKLLLDQGKTGLNYDRGSLRGKIRNYHRFQVAALDKLQENFADETKSKPLTLILHSALDDHGAFVHDEKLTSLITNNSMLTLMIEGKADLASYTGVIHALATKYGQNDKIDQVMMAGHGGATVLQMGGTIQDEGGKVKEVHNTIDIKNNLDQTRALFDELLDNMNQTGDAIKEPHRRILFNACLTNSYQMVPEGFSIYDSQSEWKAAWFEHQADEEQTRSQMQQWLQNNKNLVDYVKDVAIEKGTDIEKVVGSVASHAALDMFDPDTNALDLISTTDPQLTVEDKKDYLATGQEPGGVFKALAVCWTHPDKAYRDDALRIVQVRSQRASTDWQNTVIESMLEVFQVHPDIWGDFHIINGLNHLASTLLHAGNTSTLHASSIQIGYWIANKLSKGIIGITYITEVIARLSNTRNWTEAPEIPFSFYQAFAAGGVLVYSNHLLEHIRDKYSTVEEMRTHLDLTLLRHSAGWENLFNKGPEKGSILLALAELFLSRGTPNETAVAYLKQHLGPQSSVDWRVDQMLTGISTERAALIKLGLMPADAIADPSAHNVTLSDGTGTTRVAPITKKGSVINGNTSVYQQADETSARLTQFTADTPVFMIGDAGRFWAIEYEHNSAQTTAFIEKDKVENVSRLLD